MERSIYSLTTAISFSMFFINILLKSMMTLLYQFHEACIQEKVFLSPLSHNSEWTENEYLTGRNDKTYKSKSMVEMKSIS